MIHAVVVAVIAAGLLYLNFAVSAANIFRSRQPEVALRYAPFDGRAKAAAADLALRSLARRPGGSTARVEQLARDALLRSPLMATAWRSLAIVAELRRESSKAARLFHFTERLTRRDTPTQLWLIEESVGADDIDGALRHYSIALRTSPESSDLLVPILAQAADQPQVVAPLARLLVDSPTWRPAFYSAWANRSPPGPEAIRLLEAIRRHGPIADADVAVQVVAKLIEQKSYREAWRAFQLLTNARPGGPPVRNGNFSGTIGRSAFDWQLADDAAMQASQRALEGRGGDLALEVVARPGGIRQAATQLVLLRPGNYALSAILGPAGMPLPTRVSWSIFCANRPTAILYDGAVRTAPSGVTRVRAEFSVPADCPAQQIALVVNGADGQETGLWVDDVGISSVSGR